MKKGNKLVRMKDFMGNTIYWMNGLAQDVALESEPVCCVYPKETGYRVEFIQAGHEEKIVVETRYFKTARESAMNMWRTYYGLSKKRYEELQMQKNKAQFENMMEEERKLVELLSSPISVENMDGIICKVYDWHKRTGRGLATDFNGNVLVILPDKNVYDFDKTIVRIILGSRRNEDAARKFIASRGLSERFDKVVNYFKKKYNKQRV